MTSSIAPSASPRPARAAARRSRRTSRAARASGTAARRSRACSRRSSSISRAPATDGVGAPRAPHVRVDAEAGPARARHRGRERRRAARPVLPGGSRSRTRSRRSWTRRSRLPTRRRAPSSCSFTEQVHCRASLSDSPPTEPMGWPGAISTRVAPRQVAPVVKPKPRGLGFPAEELCYPDAMLERPRSRLRPRGACAPAGRPRRLAPRRASLGRFAGRKCEWTLMKVKFWGVRGSLPVPGRKTERYGGNTSCVEVRSEAGTRVIIDAGTGIRKLGKEMVAEAEGADRRPPAHQPHPLGPHPGAAVLLAALPEGQPPPRLRAQARRPAPARRVRVADRRSRTSRSRSTRRRPTSPSASCRTARSSRSPTSRSRARGSTTRRSRWPTG